MKYIVCGLNAGVIGCISEIKSLEISPTVLNIFMYGAIPNGVINPPKRETTNAITKNFKAFLFSITIFESFFGKNFILDNISSAINGKNITKYSG